MEKNKWEQIRVSVQVKNNLTVLKRDKSYNDYIAIMLQYFAVTNIAPESCQVHPFVDITKRLESIVKIIKGIEKSKLDIILDLLRSNINPSSELLNPENLIPLEKAKAIIDHNDALEQTVDDQNKEIERLKRKLKEAEKSNNAGIKTSINTQTIHEVCDLILNSATTDNFRTGHVSINKSELVSHIDRIKQESNI